MNQRLTVAELIAELQKHHADLLTSVSEITLIPAHSVESVRSGYVASGTHPRWRNLLNGGLADDSEAIQELHIPDTLELD